MSKFRCNKRTRKSKKQRARELDAIVRLASDNGMSTMQVVMLLEGGPIEW